MKKKRLKSRFDFREHMQMAVWVKIYNSGKVYGILGYHTSAARSHDICHGDHLLAAFPSVYYSIKGDIFVLVVSGCHGDELPRDVTAVPSLNLNLSISLMEI